MASVNGGKGSEDLGDSPIKEEASDGLDFEL